MQLTDLPVLDCPVCDQPDSFKPVMMIHPGDRVFLRCSHCNANTYATIDEVINTRADTEATAAERGIITE